MRKLALGACLAGFLAACGGDDGVVVLDGGIDAALTCDPLAPAGMQGCETGQKCTWITIVADNRQTPDDETVGKIGCVADGTAAIGGACTPGAMTPGETTGFDQCAAGGICVGTTCKDICGFDGSASAACPTGQACTAYAALFSSGNDPATHGACNFKCDPLTQLRSDGASCGEGQGCYLVTTDTETKAFCVGAGEVGHGEALSGSIFLNSCKPGHYIRETTPGSGNLECAALCKPTDVYKTTEDMAPTTPMPLSTTMSPAIPPADQVTGFASEGGVEPYSCNTIGGAADPSDPSAGESCRFWWANEQDLPDRTEYSNTVGFCFKHAVYSYDADADGTDDSVFPRCVSTTLGDHLLPIANPPGVDAIYFWCKALPAMLQNSVRGTQHAHSPAVRAKLSPWL
jgi:hypothetical protein